METSNLRTSIIMRTSNLNANLECELEREPRTSRSNFVQIYAANFEYVQTFVFHFEILPIASLEFHDLKYVLPAM